jgi:phage tail-like protein
VSPKRAPAAAARSRTALPAQPFTNLRFAIGIQGMQRSGAVEVVLPAARITEQPRKRRVVEFDPLLIRRGLTESTEWYDWWNEARHSSRAPRRLVTVVLQKANGAEAVRWLFPDSVPLAYSLSPLNALVGAVMIESLELRVGGFELYRRQ